MRPHRILWTLAAAFLLPALAWADVITYEREELPGGGVLLVKQSRQLPMVRVAISIPAGARHEAPRTGGTREPDRRPAHPGNENEKRFGGREAERCLGRRRGLGGRPRARRSLHARAHAGSGRGPLPAGRRAQKPRLPGGGDREDEKAYRGRPAQAARTSPAISRTRRSGRVFSAKHPTAAWSRGRRRRSRNSAEKTSSASTNNGTA